MSALSCPIEFDAAWKQAASFFAGLYHGCRFFSHLVVIAKMLRLPF
ncbi:MAG: hypothetical protein ACOC0U_06045 [Desulfovibrionales bacterium]